MTTLQSAPAQENGRASPDEPAEPAADPSVAPSVSPAPVRRRRRRGRLTLQSQLLMMLLGVSIFSTLVVGFIGYRSGTDSLRQAAFDRMVEAREFRTQEITRFFSSTQDALVLYTRGTTAVDALQGFDSGFSELDSATTTPEQDAATEAYYTDVFVPGLDAETPGESEFDPAIVLPDTPAQRYLQANYTVPYDDFDEALLVDDAGDGSAWSATHAIYHDYFRELILRFDYEDVMLLDNDGNVVYSAYKGADLGTNIQTGPFRGSALEQAYEEALRSNAVDFVTITDFSRYQPSYDVPTMFAVSPVGQGGEIYGVMAIQLSIDAINEVMTGDQQWRAQGLGDSGETYLVGDDGLMRSVARLLLEDPEHFFEDVTEHGTPIEAAERMVEVQGNILILENETLAVERALRAETGTVITTDYRGHEVISAYAPLPVEGLNWAIVADLNTDEAFAPVRDFARTLGISIAAIILVVSAASLLLAQVFVRPVRRLVDGVRQVAAGNLDVAVAPSRTAEFDDLSGAFNDMSRSLRTKADLIEEQQRENDRLLLTMMPESVARRYREGEETIAQDHANVSVVFADVAGFDNFAGDLPSDQSLTLLNGLIRSFDEAAERHGVERIRNLRTGYLGSCGLVTPRIDHVQRTADFTRDVQQAVERFNAQHGADLALRAGIDTGTVTSGLVGRSGVAFDMWGEAVNLAYRVQGAAGRPGIFVSAGVYDRLRESGYGFEPAGEVDTPRGKQPVWVMRLDGGAG